MKTLSKLILISAVSTCASQAATVISVNNFSTLAAGLLVVADNPTPGLPSAPLASGSRSWSVGYFDDPAVSDDTTTGSYNFSGATLATLKAHFVIFGATSTTFVNNGLINSSRSVALPANDTSFTGKTIYTMFGNAGTVVDSTAFAILATGTKFPTVDAAANGAATNATRTVDTIVWGKELTFASNEFTQPSGGSFAKAVELSAIAPVPEPSAALLGAIGALGLLRRRRN